MDTNSSMVTAGAVCGMGHGGINGDERSLPWGGEHIIQCSGDALCKHAPETV